MFTLSGALCKIGELRFFYAFAEVFYLRSLKVSLLSRVALPETATFPC